MRRYVYLFLVFLLTSPLVLGQQGKQAKSESAAQEIWRLEHLYWDYVQAFDVEHYKTLWHPDFVGWPSGSAAPVGKENIADWIVFYQKNNSKLKFAHLEPAAIQTFGKVAVVHYWLTRLWIDKEGNGAPSTVKITHTWMQVGDSWQIIGGMAAPAAPEK